MFFTVLTQVLILIILIMVGFFSSKAGLITDSGAKCCTDIALIIVTPCVIIKSLIREFDKQTIKSLLLCFIFTLLVQIIMIVLSKLFLHSKNIDRQNVLQFGSIFANCGFMSLPLQKALLGDTGVLYGSAYIIMFNLIIWSYGVFLISGDKKYISLKKIFINPGIIGLVIGLIIFIFSIPIPKLLYSSIDYVSALYTPLPMFVIGYHLSKTNVFKALKDVKCLVAVFLKLIVYPFIALAFLYICNIRGDMMVSIIISVSAPVAAITTMFSSKFSSDTPLSVDMVSFSTVLSLATMPLVITVARYIA